MKFWLASMLFAARQRRRYHAMLALDDRLLADAGVTRAEITRLAAGRRLGDMY